MTTEQSLTSRDFPVHWPVLTRWTDNDMFGHLNNAVYYELFDTAINGWINTTREIDPLAVPWLGVVAESGCNYFTELKFPDPLVVGLAVARLGNSSVTYRLALFQADQPLAAVGHWVHVYVDRETRRPIPIPGPIRSLLKSICPAEAARETDAGGCLENHGSHGPESDAAAAPAPRRSLRRQLSDIAVSLRYGR